MPRKRPEPFFREQTRSWYVQFGKKQVNLGKDEAEAWRRYHEMMARPPEAPKEAARPADPTAAEVMEEFLGWAKVNKSARTYEAYREYLSILTKSVGTDLRVSQLIPRHVSLVTDGRSGAWSNNTKNNFVTAVQRAFNWAERQGIIDRNPIRLAEKPAREAREMAISPEEYSSIIGAIKGFHFRMLVRLAWETGARPQELVRIEGRHVDVDARRIVFPPSEAKGKRSHRVIYLTDEAFKLVRSLMKIHGDGILLRNSDGKPWTKDSINCAFCRLKKKLGKKYHLGAFRKGFCTEALKNGVDTVTLAHLMGHANAAMISRVYAKVQQDPAFMARAAMKAKGNPSSDRDG